VRRFLPFIALALAACAADQGGGPAPSGWLGVLHHKKAAVSPAATTHQKQLYADSLHAFVLKNPTHGRAREVYVRVRLDFAEDLSLLGRHQDAIRLYRSVLNDDPHNAVALRGLNAEADTLTVSRQKLLSLQKGMSQRQVAQLLGKPIPGWTLRNEQRDPPVEAWYYRKPGGGVAGVYFRDGELFAAEENSQDRLAPMADGTR
jgi:hypothetical protein